MFRYTPTNVDLNEQTPFQALMSSVFVDKQSFTESKGVDSFENFNRGRIQRHVWSGRAHSGFNFFYIFHNVDTSVDCGIILNMINIVLLSMFTSLRADASPEFIV